MQLEEADIREFADLWREEFGEEISLGEARAHASQLLELYSLLAEPSREARSESPEDRSNASPP